jgi:hypothetical protein
MSTTCCTSPCYCTGYQQALGFVAGLTLQSCLQGQGTSHPPDGHSRSEQMAPASYELADSDHQRMLHPQQWATLAPALTRVSHALSQVLSSWPCPRARFPGPRARLPGLSQVLSSGPCRPLAGLPPAGRVAAGAGGIGGARHCGRCRCYDWNSASSRSDDSQHEWCRVSALHHSCTKYLVVLLLYMSAP